MKAAYDAAFQILVSAAEILNYSIQQRLLKAGKLKGNANLKVACCQAIDNGGCKSLIIYPLKK